MSGMSLSGLGVPLSVLRLLAVDFAHLPAADLVVSTIDPDLLDLSFHDGLDAFEAWREVLGISPETVSYREQSVGSTRVLQVETGYAGARVRLTGYADIPPRSRGESVP